MIWLSLDKFDGVSLLVAVVFFLLYIAMERVAYRLKRLEDGVRSLELEVNDGFESVKNDLREQLESLESGLDTGIESIMAQSPEEDD